MPLPDRQTGPQESADQHARAERQAGDPGDLAARGSFDRHEVTLRIYAAREDGSNYNRPEATESQPQFVNFESRARWHGLQLQDAV